MSTTLVEHKSNTNIQASENETGWLSKVFVLTGGHFTVDLYGGFLSPLLPLLMVKLDFTVAFAGFLTAALAFSSSFSQTLFGFLSDRGPKRFFVIAGPLIAGGFFSFIGYAPTKWLLIILVLIGGIGVAQFHPLAAKMVHQIGGRNKNKAMSIFVTGGTIGNSVGPLLITSIVALWGIEYGPVAILPALIISLLLFKTAPKQEIGRIEKKKYSLAQFKILSVYISVGIIRSMVILSFTTLMPILISLRGFPIEIGGFAVFVFNFSGGVGGFLGGVLADKISPKLLIASSFVMATPMIYFFLTLSYPIAFIFLSLAGLLLYCSIPAIITQAQAAMPQNMAIVSSMVMGFSWGIGGILVVVVGKFADIYGVYETLLALSIFPLLSALLSVPLFLKDGKDVHST